MGPWTDGALGRCPSCPGPGPGLPLIEICPRFITFDWKIFFFGTFDGGIVKISKTLSKKKKSKISMGVVGNEGIARLMGVKM